MKRRLISLLVLSILIVSASHAHVSAEACKNYESYGSVSMSIPNLPSKGAYTIWTRMQVPDQEHSQFRLDVNNELCFDVGGGSLTPNQWNWVNYYNGDYTQKVRVDFLKTSENTFTLIGTKSGVKIDRILVVKNDCVPVDLGNNCQTESVSSRAIESNGAVEVPPLNSGSVSGTVIPSMTISRAPASVARVVYYVDGAEVPTAKNFGIDTTLISNGTHRIAMQITMTNSSVVQESTVLKVENQETALTPLVRWVRLHLGVVILLSSMFGVLMIGLSCFFLYRSIYNKKRLLKFHGF